MNQNLCKLAARQIASIACSFPVGAVSRVNASTIELSGFPNPLRLGDRVEILANGTPSWRAEIVSVDQKTATALVENGAQGISVGAAARLCPAVAFSPDSHWLGRVIDPDGRPLDGHPLLPGENTAFSHAPPPAHNRKRLGDRLETGLAVFNTLLPLVRGQRVGLFAGSGVGKSTLLADFAKGVTADVVVIALVGERGRELRYFLDDVLGQQGLERSVVIAATSDRAPQTRKQCAERAMIVAEFFRDQGLHVLLLIDSITRYCEAHREIAVAGGEQANLRGFPASTASMIAQLCERAGPGILGSGDITAVFSVLVAGSDMEEPIADMLRGVLDGHVVLDREIAQSGRFPAVDVPRSVSRALPDAATQIENKLISDAREQLGTYDRAALMIKAGLYEAGSDSAIDQAIANRPALLSLITTKDQRGITGHFALLRQALKPARQ